MKLKSLKPVKDGIHKFAAVIEQDSGRLKTVKFGAAGMSDYTKHRDPERKNRYLERHKEREDWTNPLTAGFWSRWILWNLPSVSQSLADVKRRFDL